MEAKELKVKVTDKITYASLFPENYDKIDVNNTDTYMLNALKTDSEFVVFVNQGLYFYNLRSFTREMYETFNKMKKNKISATGHIMDFVEDGKIPYFHEQFLIVNLTFYGNIQLGFFQGTFITVKCFDWVLVRKVLKCRKRKHCIIAFLLCRTYCVLCYPYKLSPHFQFTWNYSSYICISHNTWGF